MSRPQDFRALFQKLVAATLVGSPIAIGPACGGAVEDESHPAKNGETTTTTDAGRAGDATTSTTTANADASKTDAQLVTRPDAAVVEIEEENVDAGVITWDAGTCGDIGKRQSQSWCDYYERQIPCGLSSPPTREECAVHCMGPGDGSDTYCYVNAGTSTLICNACPGGRKPAGYELQPSVPGARPLAAFFARLAELEAISVDAFAMLESELRAHGADESILARLRVARCDEERHALIMASLAYRHGATVPRVRFDAPATPRSLEAIATENVVEGCVRETYGALVAEIIAQRAQAEEMRKVFGVVADDEARHAELSWDLHDWLIARLDDGARGRVEQARLEAVERLRVEVAVDGDALRELGVPSGAEAVRLAEGLAKTLHAGA